MLHSDDIIFVIYLFQRWKYPTDMSRPNEYGQVFEEKSADSTEVASETEKPAEEKKKD